MRVNIQLELERPLIVPFHHNHIVQSIIYNMISDEGYRNFIHNEGFRYNGRSYKMFTFSRIRGRYSHNKANKTISYEDSANIIVSSSNNIMMQYLANTLFINDKIKIQGQAIKIGSVQVLDKRIEKERVQIFMVTPVTQHATIVTPDGKKRTHFYSPLENDFQQKIKENLVRKYKAFYGDSVNSDVDEMSFNIMLIKNNKLQERTYRYKNFSIKGFLGEFVIEGSNKLLNFAYQSGFGSKTGQGFGMFELKEEGGF